MSQLALRRLVSPTLMRSTPVLASLVVKLKLPDSNRQLLCKSAPRPHIKVTTSVASLGSCVRHMSSSKPKETEEAFDARWEAYFSRPDIDNWELRRGLNELYGHDLVPEPKIVNAMLHACRRLDDFGSAVRVLEAVKDKSAGNKEIYSYILQSCKPVIDELGVSTPEELGLSK